METWKKNAILPTIVAACLLLVYGPYLSELWVVWETDGNYSHGFLIPVISAYLVWELRDRIFSMHHNPTSLGFLPLLCGILLFLLGEGMETVAAGPSGLFVKGISLIVVLNGFVLLAAGRSHLKVLWLPILYLGFMVPLPGGIFKMITLPLQEYATQVTTSVLAAVGSIHLPRG